MRYWTQLATEQFPPSDLVQQAVLSEDAGFDGVCVSDHFQPWWEPGESCHAWPLLGAIGQATSVPIGTGVTAPVFRHNPAVVAQAFATLEEMFPARVMLGIGSGEALNESPCGMDWPPVEEQIERMDEALELIVRLFGGERVTFEGRYYRTKAAMLHTRGERPPPIWISAFGPKAARVAAKHGDGIWTIADPEQAPKVIEAWREARDELSKPEGEIVLQAGFSWAPDDDAALAGARVWKATQPSEYFTEDWHDPRAMYDHAEETVTDEEFLESYIVSSDPDHHAERIRELEKLGATVIVLQNGSGADPHGALRTYGEKVLPALRS